MTFVGFLLFILPGFAVVFLTSFTLFFVVDRGKDAVMLLDFVVCIVGLLVAIPVVVPAQAYTYRMLAPHPGTA